MATEERFNSLLLALGMNIPQIDEETGEKVRSTGTNLAMPNKMRQLSV